MSAFIEWLEGISENESKVRALLRRSLSFEPGTYPQAFPYVEYRLGGDSGWKRYVYYLTAGLWAFSRAEPSTKLKFSSAFKKFYLKKEKTPGVEKRFIALLDSDEDQLAHRLRQAVSLLKDYPIDFDDLLKDLLSWNHEEKWVQIKWAKEFYSGHDQSKG